MHKQFKTVKTCLAKNAPFPGKIKLITIFHHPQRKRVKKVVIVLFLLSLLLSFLIKRARAARINTTQILVPYGNLREPTGKTYGHPPCWPNYV